MTIEMSISAEMPVIPEAFGTAHPPATVAPGAYVNPNGIILFVHMAKTAALSLGKSLQFTFDKFHGVHWLTLREFFRQLTREALYARTAAPQRQVMAEHFDWPELWVSIVQEIPVKAINVMRDPSVQFVSNYNYNCSEKHPERDRFKAKFLTLKDFAKSLSTDLRINQTIGKFYSFDPKLERYAKY